MLSKNVQDYIPENIIPYPITLLATFMPEASMAMTATLSADSDSSGGSKGSISNYVALTLLHKVV